MQILSLRKRVVRYIYIVQLKIPSVDGKKYLMYVVDTEQTDNLRYLRAKAICHIMRYELNPRYLRENKVLRVLCVLTLCSLC